MDDIQADLMLLRGLVAREIETINHYRELATACADSGVRDFFLHIVDEEKFHIADTLRAIATIDPEQSDLLRVGYAVGHVPGELPAESVAEMRYPLPETVHEESANGSPGNPPVTKSEMKSDAILRNDSVPFGLLEPEKGSEIQRSGKTKQNHQGVWTVGSLRGIPQGH